MTVALPHPELGDRSNLSAAFWPQPFKVKLIALPDTDTKEIAYSRCCDEKRRAGSSEGSGNVFRDLGHKNADADQFKAILAAEIIKALDREGLSVRGAQGRPGIAAADFSRIRNAELGRFTVDRLMSIINRLGSRVEVKIKVRRAEPVEHIL